MDNADSQYGFGEAPAPPLTIEGTAADVLPRIDREALCGMLRRLPQEDLDAALRSKLVPVVSVPGMVLHAACGPAALAEAQRRGLRIVGTADAHDLIAAARGVHGPFLLREATFGLARRMPHFSARRRLTGPQTAVGLALATLIAAAALLLPWEAFWLFASLASGLFFLSVVALRLLCLMPPIKRKQPTGRSPLNEEELPAYSVLVPLFRETSVLGQLTGALARLRYPAEKLDIKLILEEEDVGMQAAVAKLALPPQFEVIVVPAGKPQTKPRALNYALAFCRGELLTIYDAEDIPDPDQLRKSAERFAAAGPELACLQAQLTFFNPNENWLARQFTAEYALLFARLLPVMADHRLPLPLGGTSNHFRTDVLRAVGGWDPFNVTEDADLGLRLARHGYETGTLDSLTHEEANTSLPNWMRQRARWLKGFLATWLVHMRDPVLLMRELGPAGFWVAQAVTIGVFASVLLHPICLAATFALLALYPALPEGAGLAVIVVSGINLLVFIAGYVLGIMLTRDALRHRGIFGWHATLATMPIYWLLMSGAAWLALWQFITAPFHWNKTVHGLSRFQGAGRPGRFARFTQALRRGSG
jgi:cellulose synthase/poly-beta-1,6-N-acetylglucosamine synthase-like glycosyltransferase